jgi:hypothetical protein
MSEGTRSAIVSLTVWLSADTTNYAKGGGHFWVYLNWALGLRALGCQVVWLDRGSGLFSEDQVAAKLADLRRHLGRFGLADRIALCSNGQNMAAAATAGCLELSAVAEADLLLNFRYDLPAELVGRARRSALVDIDPGLFQVWLSSGWIPVAQHDVYFSTGETVGRPEARFPDAGIAWHYAPPCVALDWWPTCRAAADAPFTTVSHWHGKEWLEDHGEMYLNDKRSGFLPYLDLPRRTAVPLELALCVDLQLEVEQTDWVALQEHGWRLRHSETVTATPVDYQGYIRGSRGEFSCAKPSCLRFQNAWISDRTLCYLASGKPAVVQHTGPSRFLPDGAGLFRFRDVAEAVRCLETAAADYDRQGRLARGLAEEHFDARKVVARVLERALA